MAKHTTLAAIFAVLFSAVLGGASHAAIPVRWTTDTYKVKPLVYECYHGETLDLASALTAYGEPLDLSGKTARIYWQTNGMDSAWWSTNATVLAESGVTNILSATFSGSFDTGANETFGFIGVEGENYRAAFTLRFRHSPGFDPAHIDPPVKILDFATISVTNIDYSPWVRLPGPDVPYGYIVVKTTNGVEWVRNEGVNTNIVEDIVDYMVGGTNTLVHTNDLQAALTTKIDMPDDSLVPVGRYLAKATNGVEWVFGGGGGGGSIGNIVRIRDVSNYWHNVRAELNPAGQIVISVDQDNVSTNDIPTVEEERDRAMMAEMQNANSISEEVERSMSVDEEMDERIKSISTVGRFLSTWDCKTGRPGTEPKSSPMEYKSGDYYIVASVSSSEFPTNYIPNGTVYTNGTASTTFVTNVVSVNDLYRHTDDGKWARVSMSGVATTFGQIAGEPRDNMKLADELDSAGQVVGFDVYQMTNGLWQTTMDVAGISNILAQGRTPLARLTTEDGVSLRAPFSHANDNQTRFTFQKSLFSEVESPECEYVVSVYDEYGVTKTDVLNTSTGHGLVRTVRVNGVDYTADTNMVVTLLDVARSNDLAMTVADLAAETNRAQTAEADVLAQLASETNRAQTAEAEIVAASMKTNDVKNIVTTNIKVPATDWVPCEPERIPSGMTWSLDDGSATVNLLYNGVNVAQYERKSETKLEYITGTGVAAYEPYPSKFYKEILDTGLNSLGLAYHVNVTNDLSEAVAGLNASIAEEMSRATNAESALDARLVAETNRAQTAEYDIDVRLVAETNRSQTVVAALDSRLVSETNRAQTAESDLDVKIVSASNSIETALAPVRTTANSALQPGDVIDNTTSADSDKPLSANMGKELQDQITNLKQRGRYLSVWNCVTGRPQTTPTVDPYTYKAGDYFIVGFVTNSPAVNYRPSGTQFSTNTPSTTVEADAVNVNDTYYFDSSSWTLLKAEQKVVTFASLSGKPYDNVELAVSLNVLSNYTTSASNDLQTSIEESVGAETTRAQTSESALDMRLIAETNRAMTAESALETQVTALEASTNYWNAKQDKIGDYTTTNAVCNIVTNNVDMSSVWTKTTFTYSGHTYGIGSIAWTGSAWIYELLTDGESPAWQPFNEPEASDKNTLKLISQFNSSLYATRETASSEKKNALGLAYRREIVPFVTNTVTKAYVEGLGIESAISASVVTNIASSASVTNLGAAAVIASETARAEAAEGTIASDLSAETTRSKAAEADIMAALISETNRAQIAEQALSTDKQDKLPAVTATERGKYLHANATSGALEWSAGGGGGEWGSITGDLYDQADLVSALDKKAGKEKLPYYTKSYYTLQVGSGSSLIWTYGSGDYVYNATNSNYEMSYNGQTFSITEVNSITSMISTTELGTTASVAFDRSGPYPKHISGAGLDGYITYNQYVGDNSLTNLKQRVQFNMYDAGMNVVGNTNRIVVCAGDTWEHGASFELYGNGAVEGLQSRPGYFYVIAHGPGTQNYILKGQPDGLLTWGPEGSSYRVVTTTGTSAGSSGNILMSNGTRGYWTAPKWLPLAGGTMTGSIVHPSDGGVPVIKGSGSTSNNQIASGGTSYTDGASIWLSGKSVNHGGFGIDAYNGMNRVSLIGNAKGNLYWNNRNVVNVPEDNTGWLTCTLNTTYVSEGTILARRLNGVVYIYGQNLTFTSAITGSTKMYTLATLPSGCGNNNGFEVRGLMTKTYGREFYCNIWVGANNNDITFFDMGQIDGKSGRIFMTIPRNN